MRVEITETGVLQEARLEIDRLRTQKAALLAMLRAIIDDYEHCAPNADGDIEPWRKRLIRKTRAALAAEKGEA